MRLFVAIDKESDEDSKVLLSELNSILIDITGDDGTVNFSPNDVAEIKRIYARKNNS